MGDLLLAEELLLIALDDETGGVPPGFHADPGLAGALLLDLIASGALAEDGGRLVATAGPEPAHPLLADALAAVATSDEPRRARHWIDRLPRRVGPLRGRVADGLVERGILERDRRRILGVLPRTVLVQADGAPERELRARLEAALLHGAAPEPGTAQLVALVHATGLIGRVAPRERRREAERRAEAIAASSAVGGAVRGALREIQAALAVAVTVAASTASS